jgi:hypothetical protein
MAADGTWAAWLEGGSFKSVELPSGIAGKSWGWGRPPSTPLRGLLVPPVGRYVGAVVDYEREYPVVVVWSLDVPENAINISFPADSTGGATQPSTFALGPGGQTAAVAFNDGEVQLVSASKTQRYETVVVAPALQAAARAMAFSPDGAWLAASRADGATAIWRTTSAEVQPSAPDWPTLHKALRERTTACFSAADRQRLLAEEGAVAQQAAAACTKTYGLKTLRQSEAAAN